MAEQSESSSRIKIGPSDIKRLANHLDDHFSGINPKEKPLEHQNLVERYDKWVNYLETMDKMVAEKHITSQEKNWIIAMLICKKENDSDHDSLTGLYNREGFKKTSEVFFNKTFHEKTKLSVAYLDMDNFKNLNDQKGHGEGDDLLRKLASILEGTKRKQDITCRWGGDEFLILFNLDEKGSQKVIDRMEKILSRFINVTYTDLKKPLGFTTGIVSWDNQENLTDFLNRADEKLRASKEIKKETHG